MAGLVSGEGFLAQQLPLSPVAATPVELLSKSTDSIQLYGSQALTVIFSRPVIALGSDFGEAELPESAVPFTLTCPNRGRLRWVTTNIARYDPVGDWPPDLDCQLVWNTDLVTWDGVPLQLDGAPTGVRLTTDTLTLTLGGIASESANAATGNQWNALEGMPDDRLPEVPPDGNITLYFSYPVVLSQLQAALQVAAYCNTSASDVAGTRAQVLPCYTPWQPMPLDVGPSDASTPALSGNATCAVVRLSPALPPGAGVIITLPAGSRYNTYAGALKNPVNVTVYGLRQFRIPLRQDFQQLANATSQFDYPNNAINYRRWRMWLPHGLADGVTAEDVSATVSLCAYEDPYVWESKCVPVDYELERLTKGTLLMTVPTMLPRQHFRLAVGANSKVKDAYGLPLKASEAYFFSNSPYPDLKGPATNDLTLVLEPSAEQLTWPFVAAGPYGTGLNPWADGESLSQGAAWQLAGTSDVLKALAAQQASGVQPNKTLGAPVDSWARPNQSLPSFGSATLPGGQGAFFAGPCCTSSGNTAYGSPLILVTDLQAAVYAAHGVVTVWVTNSQGDPQPIPGARVEAHPWSWATSSFEDPFTCTTDAEGTCTINPGKDFSGSLQVVVTKPGHGLLLVRDVYRIGDPNPSDLYTGTLALDRLLVRPGDKLHVTGYIQHQVGADMKLPLAPMPNLTLQISPNPSPGALESFKLPLDLDATYGSIHAVVSIPANAVSQQYTLSLQSPPPPTSQEWQGEGAPGSQEIASVLITVSDPRPPTALLNLTMPTWAPPDSDVTLLLAANSYIGADVAGAQVTLAWNTPRASGVVNVTTDAKGAANVTLPLASLPDFNATVPGDTLLVTATWIDPTRALVTEEVRAVVAQGPVSVSLVSSPRTDVPGVPFSVAATVVTNEEVPQELTGVVVEVSLAPANASTPLSDCNAAALASLSEQRCRVVSARPDLDACSLQLPCLGQFVLRACAVEFANGTEIAAQGAARDATGPPSPHPCNEAPIGRNLTQWQGNPWQSALDLQLVSSQVNYTLGQEASVQLVNPSWGPTSGLVIWGNGVESKQQLLPSIAQGAVTIPLGVLGKECEGGCSVTLIASNARPAADADTPTPLPSVPTSKLFDPLAPNTAVATITLAVLTPNALNVTVAVQSDAYIQPDAPGGDPVALVAPGDTADIVVTAVDAETGLPAAGAQVTLVVVDQAILDLLPYPLPELATAMDPKVNTGSETKTLDSARATRIALNATFTTLRRRLLSIDPFLPLDTVISPSPYFDPGSWFTPPSYLSTPAVDIPDLNYTLQYLDSVTTKPFYFWGSQRYPASAAAAKGDASAALRLSSEFAVVPLFKVLVAKTDGEARAVFKAPPNLGAFVVRAFVAWPNTGPGKAAVSTKYGANETNLVVRRPISLTPSVPRQVRVGDAFQAGVIVTAPDLTNGTVSASVEATTVAANSTDGSLVLLPADPASQELLLTPAKQTQEVRFDYNATGVGNATLRFTARVKGAVVDDVAWELTVGGRQLPVFVATSFVLAPTGGEVARSEGLELPAAEPGSGTLSLVSGVGHLPAVQGTYSAIAEAETRLTYPTAYNSVALVTLPGALAVYGARPNASQANATKAAVPALKLMTDNDAEGEAFGLQYSVPAAGPWYANPTSADVTLNSWAAWTTMEAGKGSGAKGVPAEVAGLRPDWLTAASNQLTKDAEEARKRYNATYDDYETWTWAVLALGVDWQPDTSDEALTTDLSFDRLLAEWRNMTAGPQARVGLAALAAGMRKEVQPIVESLLGSIRIAGRTAYVAAEPGSSAAAADASQALVLLLLLRTAPKNPLLPPLAAYVAGGGPVTLGPTAVEASAFEGALQGIALSAYDTARGSTAPDISLAATVSNATASETLLTARFTVANAGAPVTSSTPFAELPSGGVLLVTARGRGEASVAAGLDFVPADLMPFPTYRGLWVERVIADEDGEGAFSVVSLGRMVTVVVQVTSPDDLQQVAVDVAMPGGLEPVDPLLYPDADLSTLCGGQLTSYWRWSPCPTQETSPKGVRFTYPYFPAGTASIRFKAIAATPGSFVLPPVKAFVLAQPEVMGLSSAGTVGVCATPLDPLSATAVAGAAGANASTCAVPAPPVQPAQACPGNCNAGSGVCNLSSGECICNAGYSGVQCANATDGA